MVASTKEVKEIEWETAAAGSTAHGSLVDANWNEWLLGTLRQLLCLIASRCCFNATWAFTAAAAAPRCDAELKLVLTKCCKRVSKIFAVHCI